MIEILSSSALATVQDQGREGYLRYGVGTAGAMDRLALAVGNLLLGNPDDAAGIEIPMFPFRIRFLEDLSFAITGADCSARLGDRPVLPWWTVHAKQGDVLTIGVPTSGTRCYLSLAGGVDVPVVLGSRSTQLRGQFGGFNGRQLQKGDVVKAVGLAERVVPQDAVLAAGFGTVPPEYSLPAPLALPAADAGETVVRVLPAAEYECYEPESLEAFWRDGWKVTPQSDRYGYRLAGPTLVATHAIEKRSHGIVPGVIQVPHSGQPIIQLRDAQPSGGYPKIGTVIEADLWRLAQARIGTKIRFAQTTYAQAVTALEELDSYLVRVRNLVALFCPSRH
ncbi:5-oxoprolinase subunit C [Paraburkholderia nemoris]|uniref:5-oxoprolinase subunit C family protein n=1 Tax=Paraburkholderia nemoris TaxID=2793076 RepID=UPI00190A4EB5|nr:MULTISPECIES: biotin-dependent carboxyltransferase family protein [Paraburkholderia]MBK3739644.1 biotin-dependent carboxyltransferase family protein [Paraburkholderia aspalathi]MBK3782442.1 biotin-dependent carboxyltransferase family protein [Paraburkholderia aspalathi]CAE6703555.1 5-oxoprolinase subunit C [Paraburkholderia nemoris]CAE6738258.1 5-oxoprolinase subunit C [Paraburkholderia nemoris]